MFLILLTKIFVFVSFLSFFIKLLINSKKSLNFFKFLFLFIVYFIVSSLILNVFINKWHLNYVNERASFEDMLKGTAYKPYVYRRLIPNIVDNLYSYIPNSYLSKNSEFFLKNSKLISSLNNKKQMLLELSVKYHIMYFLLFLSLVLLLYAIRRLTKIFFKEQIIIDFAPPIALLILPLTFLHGGYFYDFPELLFISIWLISLIKKEWILYYLVFSLAILNKESNILLFLFFVILTFKNKTEYFKHLFLHALAILLLFIPNRIILSNNPGMNVENHFFLNINFWSYWRNYFSFFDPYAPLIFIIKSSNVIFIVLMLYLIFLYWKEKDIIIKKLFIVTTIINIPLSIVNGYMDEIRNLSFMFLPIYLLCVHTFQQMYLKKDLYNVELKRNN